MRPEVRTPVQFRPPVIAAACLLVSLVLHVLFPTLRFPFPGHQIVGALFALAGVSAAVAAGRRFRRYGTTVEPFETPSVLVTSGLYRYTRNPMYLGILLVLLGIAVYVASVAFLVAPLAFIIIINARQIPFEESRLSNLFGEDYAAYRRRTRRWL
jgi:protein-S-isoprenylcysteine O-methyltransferase Ste14